jgi:cytidylate kinase
VTWAAISRHVEIRDEAGVSALAEQVIIDIRPASATDGRTSDLLIDGIDATWDVRKPEVEANVSPVSTYAGVRRALTAQQRRIGLRGKVVMVGRDIGTVVLPEADLKIYLDASAEERARRRYTEIVGRGGQADYEEILSKVRDRDRIDSTRAIAPLKPAEDAVRLDSDKLNADEVFVKVEALCK